MPTKPPLLRTHKRLTAALCCLLLAALSCVLPAPAQARGGLSGAKSWRYQLVGDLGATAGSSADVAVVDADHAVGQLDRLKHKPGGGRRRVIGYLSIGEAEEGRAYWKSCCSGHRPGWLTSKTQGWAGNYVVRYWDSEWKAIVMKRLNGMIAAGFDGVYLDRADSWESMRGETSNARGAMIKLIKDVASAARAKKRDFAIIVQNAEELLTDAGYVAAIDAVAKESLFYGVHGEGNRNGSEDIKYSLRDLKRAQSAGKTIFVIEYLHGSVTDRVRDEIRSHGFVPFFGSRHLGG